MNGERMRDLVLKLADPFSVTGGELLELMAASGAEKLEVVPRRDDDTPTCAIIVVDGPRVEAALAALKAALDEEPTTEAARLSRSEQRTRALERALTQACAYLTSANAIIADGIDGDEEDFDDASAMIGEWQRLAANVDIERDQ